MSSTSLPLPVLRETHVRYVSTMSSEYWGARPCDTHSTLRLAAHGLEELVQHREGHQDDHGRGRPRGLLQLFDDAAAEATGAVAAAGPPPSPPARARAAGRARTERGRAGPALVRAAALAPTEPAAAAFAAAFAAAGAANPGALTALEPATAVSSPRPDSVAATSLLPPTAWPT